MTVTVKPLIERQQAPNAETPLYTANNATTVIDKFTATNTTGGAVTLTVHLVPKGATAGVANCVLSAKSVASNETYNCPELVGQVLANGDFISLIASAATSLTISASGREIT